MWPWPLHNGALYITAGYLVDVSFLCQTGRYKRGVYLCESVAVGLGRVVNSFVCYSVSVIRNAIRVSKAFDRVKVWFLIHQVADSHL